ncbi:hypothetical protein DPMN_067009 [Dreissena polymorpha]|uniref:Uncharacterized protein n=1 Tax=Dreissena polymorpha TaxID=45954 RepID=A0A9D4BT78_DREPO|nr:hypothetical protein DPMN_067009 [Dreissena polymorpha]
MGHPCSMPFPTHVSLAGGLLTGQWPDTYADALQQCQDHKKEKLTGFCEDHNQLICHTNLTDTDKVKDLHQKGALKQLSATRASRDHLLVEKCIHSQLTAEITQEDPDIQILLDHAKDLYSSLLRGKMTLADDMLREGYREEET